MTDALNYPASFPQKFVSYCVRNGISPEVFQAARESIHQRYLRLTASACIDKVIAEVSESFPGAKRVDWLPGHVFAVPRSARLAQSPCFQEARIAAGDAASFLTVAVLQPRRRERILDLCCSPGVKLCMISEAVSSTSLSTSGEGHDGCGCVVGVDINLDRLFVARASCRKYNCLTNTSLVCGDGTVFSPSWLLSDEASRHRVQRAHDYLARQRKRSRSALIPVTSETPQEPIVILKSPHLAQHISVTAAHPQIGGVEENSATDSKAKSNTTGAPMMAVFDRVLVDAECTHDGSLAHLDFSSSESIEGEQGSHPHVLGGVGQRGGGGISNAHRMEHINICSTEAEEAALFQLQLSLLKNAASLARPRGGIVVYSTCSFSSRQNEEVVKAFLEGSSLGAEFRSIDPLDSELLVSCSGSNAACDSSTLGSEDDVAVCVRWTRQQLEAARSVTSQSPFGRRIIVERAQTSFQFLSKLVRQ